MTRINSLLILICISVLFSASCSSPGNPLTPSNPASGPVSPAGPADSPSLWGYWDIILDTENMTGKAVLNRNVMFAVNVVKFLNNNPASLGFSFNGVSPNPGYIEVDLDLSISHPIPDESKFNGYDVRGVLIGDGGVATHSNFDLVYPVDGMNQYIVNSDGYTRWFNQAEFPVEGIFGYTPGMYGSAGFLGSGTLNGYKYFADNLGPADEEWDFLLDNETYHGVFSSGSTNTRNYIIRFPTPSPGVKFGYAVVANWGGAQPSNHPSNCEEAAACDVTVYSDIWYTSEFDKGGKLKLDFLLWCWNDLPTSMIIESTVLNNFYNLNTAQMTPVLTGENWAKWHVEVNADNITGTEGNEFWVLASFGGHKYTSPTGIPNEAESDTLVAAFRFDLEVASEPIINDPPVINSGVNGPDTVSPDAIATYAVVATDPELDPLEFSWRVTPHNLSNVVFSGPGNGAGLFDVDWANDCGAGGGDSFDVYCDVTDGFNDPVHATKLVVNVENSPPEVEDIVGPSESAPTATQTYSVYAFDPDGDTLTYEWIIYDHGTTDVAFTGPGDGAGTLEINWGTDVGADWNEQYDIICRVSDTWNPYVQVGPLVVTMVVTLFHYDGTVDDGGIVNYTGSGTATWAYCTSSNSWDENECGDYTQGLLTVCMTPVIDFPEAGTFNTIHYEIRHWGDMQSSGSVYGNLATLEPKGGGGYNVLMNAVTNWLVYIEGFDFNDGAWDDFTGTFGSQTDPVYSHFDCNAYAGESYAIGFAFYQSGEFPNPGNDGWNIRELKIWYE